MDPNESKQPTPDYSFITTQNNPVIEKPGSKMKFVILGALATLFLLTVVLVVTSTKKNVKSTLSSEDTVKQQLNLVNEGKTEESLALFAKAKSVTLDQYKAVWVDTMAKDYDLSSCVVVPKSTGQDINTVRVFCGYSKNKSEGTILTYYMDNKSGLIDKVDYIKGGSNDKS